MRIVSRFRTMAMVAAVLSATIGIAAAQEIKAAGTGTALEMLRQVGAAFSAMSGVKVQVLPSLGSSGAIGALKDGVIDLAVSARPLKAEEEAAGLKQVAVMRTAFVLVSSQARPDPLRAADLSELFTRNAPMWTDGTPVRIILRPRSESDTTIMGAMSAGMPMAIETLRARSEVPLAATDQHNADMAERMPGSLTGTTMAQLKAEKRDLRIVPLDSVAPTLANVESGAYPFVKKLHFILRANGSPEVARFMDFLRSPQGEKALRNLETVTWIE